MLQGTGNPENVETEHPMRYNGRMMPCLQKAIAR